MSLASDPQQRLPLLLTPLLGALLAALIVGGASGRELAYVAAGGAVVISVLYLTAFVDLAWLFSAAIALTVFSGDWRELGLPNFASPDRLMLIVAVLAFLLRNPGHGRRSPVRLSLVHGVLLATLLYAICSAVLAGTITDRSALFPLIDSYGLVPFVFFISAPAVYATEAQRRILLGTLVVIGAYLGLTAFCEGVGLRALVFPKYILDPNFGYQPGRARGPFAESAVNGVALYFSAVAAMIGFVTWRDRRRRWGAAAVAALCLFDLIFTLERSVWIGAIAATLITMGFVPGLRRYIAPALVGIGLAVVAALALVGGLSDRIDQRVNDSATTWDRKNLNRAAENMVLARPMVGFGRGTFQARSGPYFEQSADYPLTNTGGAVHNVFLSNAAELGLIGTSIWLAALLIAVGGAILVRGPPELYAWRVGLVAVALMWLVVANLIPMTQVFPNAVLWLWAGVVWPWRHPPPDAGSG